MRKKIGQLVSTVFIATCFLFLMGADTGNSCNLAIEEPNEEDDDRLYISGEEVTFKINGDFGKKSEVVWYYFEVPLSTQPACPHDESALSFLDTPRLAPMPYYNRNGDDPVEDHYSQTTNFKGQDEITYNFMYPGIYRIVAALDNAYLFPGISECNENTTMATKDFGTVSIIVLPSECGDGHLGYNDWDGINREECGEPGTACSAPGAVCDDCKCVLDDVMFEADLGGGEFSAETVLAQNGERINRVVTRVCNWNGFQETIAGFQVGFATEIVERPMDAGVIPSHIVQFDYNVMRAGTYTGDGPRVPPVGEWHFHSVVSGTFEFDINSPDEDAGDLYIPPNGLLPNQIRFQEVTWFSPIVLDPDECMLFAFAANQYTANKTTGESAGYNIGRVHCVDDGISCEHDSTMTYESLRCSLPNDPDCADGDCYSCADGDWAGQGTTLGGISSYVTKIYRRRP